MGKPAAVVWDRSFLGYDLGGDHPLNPVRLDLTVRLATALGVLDGVELRVPEPAGDEEIELVHKPGYLSAVQAAPTAGWDVGHGLGTPDNPVFERMHEASALVVGGSLVAARAIASGEVDRAVNIAGGLHHAMPDSAAGFCVYNDCAVAIEWLLRSGVERIAYVDVDVHHGDGVQTAFWDDPRVLTISLHQHPMSLWPGTGWAGEVGGAGAEGSAVNVPLPAGTRDGSVDAGVSRDGAVVVAGVPAAGAGDAVRCRHAQGGSARGPVVERGRASGDLPGVPGPRERARVQVARARGWRVRAAQGGAAVVDAPAGHGPGSRRRPESAVAGGLDRARDTDRARVAFACVDDGWMRRWAPAVGRDAQEPVDKAIRETRRAVFPLHGLDPDDPRD